ncbi:uncharacterized protein LOC131048833 [Cryptomeria japonica]|uniref:uncharacterized protein LOC131048833 n=1 Tax=Cryptomeria japonica TaxID=3369 RepID=UPI0025AD3E2B|nr:uncharacterized protein LOC131048833 [Cryptomeria japonica]
MTIGLLAMLSVDNLDLSFLLFNFYGPIKFEDKLMVWNEVAAQINMMGKDKAILAGDFNALLDMDEKVGGLRKPTKVMEDSREFISNCNLVNIIQKNGKFTWTNRRRNFANISERLDRFLVGEWWINGNKSLFSEIAPHVGSDHLPLILSISQEFRDNLKAWWQESNVYSGSPSFKFVKRMHYLKNKIKAWNKYTFKNIHFEKIRIEKELEVNGNQTMRLGMTNVEYELERTLKAQYMEILGQEELYWKDKSRELWIVDGDLNTKFFHASSKSRRIKNKICVVKDVNGVVKQAPGDIEQMALRHFMKILG